MAADGVGRAAALLRDGALVAFPTETVYGLGADATDDVAVARIFEAKGRPRFNPLIVHVPSLDAAQRIGDFDADALRLALAFWPGPLTLVVPLRPDAGISPLVTAGLDTIALRVPDAALARRLLEATGRPVAAPSANPSGKVSPTRAEHVLAGLGGRIEAVLDGGPCGVGVESTIIGTVGGVTLLRPGGLTVEAVEGCLGHALKTRAESDAITAPGQLSSHYAPDAALRLNADTPEPGERYVGFGPDHPSDITLSASGDLVEAAARLFHLLRGLDAGDSAPIAIAPIPETGLGRAINDRLRRAAAPRG
ncbi:L-threonylcarbamoyladenylate synthase [Anianabacter salinae]|uniref:L-threonylcarbamoyladenylate synthase n=1 Tax=Anianabacter salinae TaxID=2851023 RepID=UPI00225DE3E1|nr:L-threonylcarbamoyladenylate synthase [Anianabacter salinae]MBV0913260.1 threonylcarbamoyl-AMP synthase [Anianabacter salinae]